MRKTFIDTLTKYGNNNIYLMIGDLGYSVVEQFGNKFHDNLINCGIAEQNMTGMAAGFALEGSKVFTYSIANFNTLRCLEQIRNDISYHDLDVTIVSVGGGFVYGSAGYSHHSIQDIGTLGSLPNMTLLLPTDPLEVEFCVRYALNNKGPKYLRIGKNGSAVIHPKNKELKIVNFFNNSGGNIAIVGVGGLLQTAEKVVTNLNLKKIKTDLVSIPIINESFKHEILESFGKYTDIFILEDHISSSGVSSILRDILQYGSKNIYGFGVKQDLCRIVGKQDYLIKIHELDEDAVFKKIITILNKV